MKDLQLICINSRYADYFLKTGAHEWRALETEILERIESNGNEQLTLTFAIVHIAEANHLFQIYLDLYMNRAEQIPKDTEFSKCASKRMRLALTTSTCPSLHSESQKLL